MGIVIRQSIKTAVVTFAGVFLGLIINLLSIRVFEKTDLGFTQNLIKASMLLCYFAILGFNSTLVIYGQKYHREHPKRASFLTISIIVPLLSLTVIILLYFIFKDKVIHMYHSGDELLMARYYILFPLLTLLVSIILWMEGYLQSIYKTAIQSFAREILNRLIYLALIFLYAYHLINFDTFIWWYVLLYLVPIVYLAYFIYRFDGFKFGYTKGDFTNREILRIISFAFNQTFVVISAVLIIQIDTILIGPLAYNGLEAIAIYGTAAFAISVIKNPIRALSLSALPSLSDAYQKAQLKKLRANFIKSASVMQLLVLFLSVGILLCANEIQYLINLLKPGYESVSHIMLILLIGHVIDVLGGLSLEVLTLSKYYLYNTLFSFSSLIVIVILIYNWIDVYGLQGVAWASSIGMVMYAVLKSVFLYRKLGIQPYTVNTLKIAGISIVALAACYFLNLFSNPICNMFLKGGIYSILFLGLSMRLKISEEFNELVKKYLPFIK